MRVHCMYVCVHSISTRRANIPPPAPGPDHAKEEALSLELFTAMDVNGDGQIDKNGMLVYSRLMQFSLVGSLSLFSDRSRP